LQNDFLQDLPASHGLDSSDQAVAAMSIAQSALAPLLLGREQTLYRAELGEGVIVESVYTVKRHLHTSELLLHGCPRPQDAGIQFLTVKLDAPLGIPVRQGFFFGIGKK
jgi:hypothetical protein